MYDIFLEFSAKVERLSKMYKCELMDSPIIAIGKVESTRQDNSYRGPPEPSLFDERGLTF